MHDWSGMGTVGWAVGAAACIAAVTAGPVIRSQTPSDNAAVVRTTKFAQQPAALLESEVLAYDAPFDMAKLFRERVEQPLVNEGAHPIKAITLPSQVQELDKPVKVRRPAPHRIAEADDDGPDRRHDGVCARYGGHRHTFYRHHHQSWRCIYPHRR